jgi:uncharacterized protein YrrD
MRKGKNVIGQAVFSRSEGRRLHTVKDVVLGETNASIVALLVDEGGLLSSSQVIPIEEVESFGRDSVVISSTEAVTSASADPEVKAIVNRNDKLLGKRVLTSTGDVMGSISDMYFEEGTGRIAGFEVSGGVLGDLARGTSYLATEEIELVGPDVIFVRPEVGENLEGQVGGVQGALQDAGTKLKEGAARAKEGAARAGEQAKAGIAEREPERALIGRRSGMDVTDENGSIIVANGQRIRAEHVERARATGNVDLLSRAAAAGQATETRERMGAGLEQAGDSVGAMWDRFTSRLSQMRDEQGKQADEAQTRLRLNQIADAIGRPVGKVILDRGDNVILDFGDIITHQAVQRAYDSGMLDTLLASVYRAEFGLPLDSLRADQPASARVEQATGGAQIVDELEQKVQQTEQERAERQERERQEAEAAQAQREREREERARARQQADAERQRELEQVKAEAARSGGAAAPAPGGNGDRGAGSTTRVDPRAVGRNPDK